MKTWDEERGTCSHKGETQLSVSPKISEEQGFKFGTNGCGIYLREGCNCVVAKKVERSLAACFRVSNCH